MGEVTALSAFLITQFTLNLIVPKLVTKGWYMRCLFCKGGFENILDRRILGYSFLSLLNQPMQDLDVNDH
jgi:hypothetical protein